LLIDERKEKERERERETAERVKVVGRLGGTRRSPEETSGKERAVSVVEKKKKRTSRFIKGHCKRSKSTDLPGNILENS